MRVLTQSGKEATFVGKTFGTVRAVRLDSLPTCLQETLSIEGVKSVALINEDESFDIYTMYNPDALQDSNNPLAHVETILKKDTKDHLENCACQKCICLRSFR